ncbi:hypothetical protein K466DRAFT_603603 [Polyporus arcularius HHB13444]|uniref:Uncharacterized protein n=1 Tax=Polyporus arcularius HHB13444 TaxID=1314778 RepID=A0A5C3NYL8_9APHY|nr:hypothetical protein K466DRAFT_603603 [Polyporus arcularius HHB13444]
MSDHDNSDQHQIPPANHAHSSPDHGQSNDPQHAYADGPPTAASSFASQQIVQCTTANHTKVFPKLLPAYGPSASSKPEATAPPLTDGYSKPDHGYSPCTDPMSSEYRPTHLRGYLASESAWTVPYGIAAEDGQPPFVIPGEYLGRSPRARGRGNNRKRAGPPRQAATGVGRNTRSRALAVGQAQPAQGSSAPPVATTRTLAAQSPAPVNEGLSPRLERARKMHKRPQ